jgi:hypothetical protein
MMKRIMPHHVNSVLELEFLRRRSIFTECKNLWITGKNTDTDVLLIIPVNFSNEG